MSNRLSYALVVLMLLGAAVLRISNLPLLPPGMSADEILDARITETARQGRIEVFYDIEGASIDGDAGREGLYSVMLAGFTSFVGAGAFGYRLFSVFIGMITLALMYALGRRLLGAPAGLGAMAILAVGLFPILLSRSIGREMLLPLWVTATLLALALAYNVYGDRREREPTTLPFAALGTLLGLGFYIHPMHFLLTLFAMIFIVYRLRVTRPVPRRILSYSWFALVILIVFATPYLISSLQNPELNGTRRVLNDLVISGDGIIRALGGVVFVGDADATHNIPGRPLLDLFSGMLMVIGLGAAFYLRKQPRFVLMLLALLIIALPALFAAHSPDFDKWAAALPLFALLFATGGVTIARGFPKKRRPIIAAAAVGLFLFNMQWTAHDLLSVWATLPGTQTAYSTRLGAIAHYLDRTVDNISTVLCTDALTSPSAPRALTERQVIALMMHRQNAPIRYADCGSAFILTSGGDAQQVVLDSGGIRDVHPYIREWLAQGERVEDRQLPPNTVIRLDVRERLANTIGAFTTTAPAEYAPDSPGGRGVAAPPVRFEGNIAYLGDVRTWAGAYAPGGDFALITFWRVDGIVPRDLRLFTHILLDPADCCAAQNDTIGVRTAELQPRDIFMQITSVQLPFTLPEGEYAVSVGAYEDNTGSRLRAFDGERPRGSRLFLGMITVVRQ